MNTKLTAAKRTGVRHSISLPVISRALSLTLFCALSGALGCKNFFVPVNDTTTTTTPVTNTGDYVYVASVNTGSTTNLGILSGFSVGTASLTALTGFPLLLPFAPSTAVVTPSNALLYVCGSEVLYGYTISSTGALTSILNANQQQALVNANILQMVVSPDGNWLLGLDQTPDGNLVTIDEYAISSTGQLTAAAGAQYALTGGATIVPNGIAVSPNGDYVAVALGTGGDVLFSFNTTTGVLTQVNQIDTGSDSGADQAVAFDSTSSILFVAQSGTGAGVVPFVISNGGATLTSVSGAPFATGAGASSMVVDSTGKYLYVGNKVDSTISGFAIGSGGVLTALNQSPYPAGSAVDALAHDNSGKYILSTALNGTPDLEMYSFDTTNAGALDASTTASTGDPTEPAGAVALAATH
jgi:6-phosphogluconolactonase (cycloisomerase 2 family)